MNDPYRFERAENGNLRLVPDLDASRKIGAEIVAREMAEIEARKPRWKKFIEAHFFG